jgi:hypothetical protein
VVRRYVEDNFSVEAMTRKYIRLYEEALQRKSREHAA